MNQKIDAKIKSLVDYLNSLEGVHSIASCEGHNDTQYKIPHITFLCSDEDSLSLIATIAGVGRFENPELQKFKTNAEWSVIVEPGIPLRFCLHAKPKNQEDQPSIAHSDFQTIIDFYKTLQDDIQKCKI